ncbi:hypothetical protein PMAYCL1PPCAC_08667, partial [Pristionchus mayeri]
EEEERLQWDNERKAFLHHLINEISESIKTAMDWMNECTSRESSVAISETEEGSEDEEWVESQSDSDNEYIESIGEKSYDENEEEKVPGNHKKNGMFTCGVCGECYPTQ